MTATRTASTKSRTATAIRFPDQLHDRLKETAEQYDFSINYLVVKAVEDFLPRMIPVNELKLTRGEATNP